MLTFTVTVTEKGMGNFIYYGVEAYNGSDARHEILRLHRSMLKNPSEIELTAIARPE